MSPAQVARRLDRFADEIAGRSGATAPRAPAGAAIPLGVAVAALLHTVSGDMRARAAQARSISAEPKP